MATSLLFERQVIRGRLFAAGASAHRPATLTLEADGTLCLTVDGQAGVEKIAPPRWSSRVGSSGRRTELADGRIFETHDNDAVDTLERKLGGASSSFMHRLEHLRLHLLALAAVAVVAFVIGLRWVIPWIGDISAQWVPYSVEARIGEGVMTTLDRAVLRPSKLSEPRQAAIQAVFDDLSRHSSAPPGSLKLAFRSGAAVGANALALPGGWIVVTDDLVELAREPETVAGVLAHEIAHVEERHGLRRLARVAGLSAVTMLMTGDVSDMVHEVAVLGAGVLDLSYSRAFEREADARAVALLQRSGRDPESLALLLERLTADAQRRGEPPAWLSSHPPTAERARAIRQAP